MQFIPYGRQSIDEKDIQAVVDVLRSDFLTQGPQVPVFEELVSKSVNASYAVAMNSATSALHSAMHALEVGRGDVVWVPAISFVASSNAALYCGASVEFVDIDTETFNLSISDLESRLKLARMSKALPKVVVAVHMCGTPPDLKSLRMLSEEYGFKIVEDASHAVGARSWEDEVGSCKWSDITIFSFHPVKIVTSGEGGMATTNSEAYAQRMAQFRSHGITRQFDAFEDKSQGAWHYEQQSLGYNYRLPEISAVLGASQFSKRESFVRARHKISTIYRSQLSDYQFQKIQDGNRSSHHLEIIQVDSGKRRELFDHLRSHGIGVNVHYAPIFTQPYYRNMNRNWGNFPNSIDFFSRAISLPIFPSLRQEEQEQVVDLIKGHKGSQIIF